MVEGPLDILGKVYQIVGANNICPLHNIDKRANIICPYMVYSPG
jgi:hypothetical protein